MREELNCAPANTADEEGRCNGVKMDILHCLTHDRAFQFVFAAGAVCGAGSYLFSSLISRARGSSGSTSLSWVLLSGIVGGCMVWATHLAALIGLSCNIAHSFSPWATLLALSFAIMGITVAAFMLSLEDRRWAIGTAGALIGLVVVGTHFVGLHAIQLQGVVEFNSVTIVAGIALSVGTSAFAVHRLIRPLCNWCFTIAVVTITLGSGATNLVLTAAMTVTPSALVQIDPTMTSDIALTVAMLTGAALLFLCVFAFYAIDTSSTRATLSLHDRLANKDALTGLPNRTSVHRELEDLLAAGGITSSGIGILCFDLRGFRNVNVAHGFAAGDEILRMVTRRLSSRFEGRLSFGRIGGDEFVALVPQAGILEITSVATELRQCLSSPVFWRSKSVILEASVGIATYPADGRTADLLLSRAFLALRRARASGTPVAYHDERRDEAMRTKSELALDLRQALQRGEFELHYQRQNSALTRELIGFEVLLRWKHPERGMVPPQEFIPLAEAYGFIGMIGEWVLRTACKEAAGWNRPYKIAVNVAPDQLSDPRFPEIVRDALRASGLPASRLELEMTESGIVADPVHTRRIIDRLKALGVSLAMDDYGTGNSSLSTLQNYPFDKIKIDKSFVTSVGSDPQAAAIVRSTVILGRSLKIPILAEGVETEIAMSFLKRVGCSEVQGFLFGKPVPASAISELHQPA